MLETKSQIIFTTPPPSLIKSLYAKAYGQLYEVELKYKANGLFILRPVGVICTAERILHGTAEQVRAMQLFPIFGA
jgi:hypothetical protein